MQIIIKMKTESRTYWRGLWDPKNLSLWIHRPEFKKYSALDKHFQMTGSIQVQLPENPNVFSFWVFLLPSLAVVTSSMPFEVLKNSQTPLYTKAPRPLFCVDVSVYLISIMWHVRAAQMVQPEVAWSGLCSYFNSTNIDRALGLGEACDRPVLPPSASPSA